MCLLPFCLEPSNPPNSSAGRSLATFDSQYTPCNAALDTPFLSHRATLAILPGSSSSRSRSINRPSVFNVFKSAIAYDTSIKSLPNLAKEGGEEQMVEYEFEPDTKEEVMQVRQIDGLRREILLCECPFFFVRQQLVSLLRRCRCLQISLAPPVCLLCAARVPQ